VKLRRTAVASVDAVSQCGVDPWRPGKRLCSHLPYRPPNQLRSGFDEWPTIATRTPQRSDDHVAFVEGVVQVASDLAKVDAPKTRNVRVDVRGAGAGKKRG